MPSVGLEPTSRSRCYRDRYVVALVELNSSERLINHNVDETLEKTHLLARISLLLLLLLLLQFFFVFVPALHFYCHFIWFAVFRVYVLFFSVPFCVFVLFFLLLLSS
jgi:hypothetical protein